MKRVQDPSFVPGEGDVQRLLRINEAKARLHAETPSGAVDVKTLRISSMEVVAADGFGRRTPWRMHTVIEFGRTFVRTITIGAMFEYMIHEKHGPVDAAIVQAWIGRTVALGEGLSANHRQWGSQHGGSGADVKKFIERGRWWNLAPQTGERLGAEDFGSGGPPFQSWDIESVSCEPVETLACVRTIDAVASSWLTGLDAPCTVEDLFSLRKFAGIRAEKLRTKDVLRFGVRYYAEVDEETAVSMMQPPYDNGSLSWFALVAVYLKFVERHDLVGWLESGLTVLPENERPPPAPAVVPEPERMEWVYVIRESDGDRVKIGRTEFDDPMVRIRQHMKSSSQGRDLVIVFLLRGPIGLETTVLAEFESERVPSKKEWFFHRGALAAAITGDGFDLADRLGVTVHEMTTDKVPAIRSRGPVASGSVAA